MEYTVVLTRENSRWRAVAKDLPECVVEASTRDLALTQLKARIAESQKYMEILKVEVPDSQNSNGSSGDSIKSLMGIFKDDPTLDELFDEIERRRDQHLAGD